MGTRHSKGTIFCYAKTVDLPADWSAAAGDLVAPRHLRPVDGVVPGLNVLRAQILVLEVIRVSHTSTPSMGVRPSEIGLFLVGSRLDAERAG